MMMKPQLLFSIGTEHTYFGDKKCSSILIEPAPDCRKLLNRYRLPYKLTPEGGLLVCFTGLQPEAIAKDADAVFNFCIYANDPAFQAYTRLPPEWPGKIYWFSNRETDAQQPAGVLQRSVVRPPIGQAKPDRIFYGLVSIYARTLPAVNRFTLSFEAAGCIWKYYLLADSQTGDMAIECSIPDTGFEKNTALPDGVAASLAGLFPDAVATLYTSTAEIQLQEGGIRNIRLVRAGTRAVLVNHLPNPGIRENGTKIINMRT